MHSKLCNELTVLLKMKLLFYARMYARTPIRSTPVAIVISVVFQKPLFKAYLHVHHFLYRIIVTVVLCHTWTSSLRWARLDNHSRCTQKKEHYYRNIISL